jgi:uncharacterized repeat protein (TIGR03803 family)
MLFALSGIFVTIAEPPAVQAQTFQVLHSFTGQGDGGNPVGTPTLDAEGNLDGTTVNGGEGLGTVYKLTSRGSGWLLKILYDFGSGGQYDGFQALGQLVQDSRGIIYGATHGGGLYGEDGTVFQLRPSPTPPAAVIAPWMETLLHSFGNGSDGSLPDHGDLTIDPQGNLYGTTYEGGSFGWGTVYKLTPSGGGWTYQMLYSFSGGTDGGYPVSGVVLDAVGNLYGTTQVGGMSNWGVVYQLTQSGSETVLYSFTGIDDGLYPLAGVIFDSFGNLYGATSQGGSGLPCNGAAMEASLQQNARVGARNGTDGAGVVFRLSPGSGGWIYTSIYPLPGTYGTVERLVMDPAGDIYGTSEGGLYQWGWVFELTPGLGGWTCTSLHDFTNGTDGGTPEAGLVRDSNGNLYGASFNGGLQGCGSIGCGVIWEITP